MAASVVESSSSGKVLAQAIMPKADDPHGQAHADQQLDADLIGQDAADQGQALLGELAQGQHQADRGGRPAQAIHIVDRDQRDDHKEAGVHTKDIGEQRDQPAPPDWQC